MKREKRSERVAAAKAGDGRSATAAMWPWIVAPILLLAVVGGGFLLGRTMARRGSAAALPGETAAVAPTIAVESGPVDEAGGQQLDQETLARLATAQAVAANPVSRYDPDTVYDLERLPHPLLGRAGVPRSWATEFATGEELRLSDFRGQVLFLDFWGTWCGPCRIEMPWIEAVFEKYADQGLAVVGYDVGDRRGNPSADADVQRFVDQYGVTFPIMVTDTDTNIAVQEAWSVVGYPSAFVIDADGVVVDYHRSMFPNQVTLESRLMEVLTGATGGP